MTIDGTLLGQAAHRFAAELTYWRLGRGLSKKTLAEAMGFDPSYVSHIEAGRYNPTECFARRAEVILETSGRVWGRYLEYARARDSSPRRESTKQSKTQIKYVASTSGLVIEREITRISYKYGQYFYSVKRWLYNAGEDSTVVQQYPIRVVVDRFPNDSIRSNDHHHRNPLSLSDLGLIAKCADEPMRWKTVTDRDAEKELWLQFENEEGKFPLYPRQRATIEYAYHVSADKWGQWFERVVTLPTESLVIEIELPASLNPTIWGLETSLSYDNLPLRTPIKADRRDNRTVFRWETQDPALQTGYRLEWRLQHDAANPAACALAALNHQGSRQNPGATGDGCQDS